MDSLGVLDLSEALSQADGDRDLVITLAGLFLQESPKEVAAAKAALARQDAAGLAAAAHKLKGSIIPICAPRLFASAKRLEELGRQGELVEAAAVCADIDRLLAEVHDALRELIAGGLPS